VLAAHYPYRKVWTRKLQFIRERGLERSNGVQKNRERKKKIRMEERDEAGLPPFGPEQRKKKARRR